VSIPPFVASIHDGGARHLSFALQTADGNRNVIEDAIPRAFRRKRVMRPSGEIAAEAVAERVPGSCEGAAERCQRSLDQRSRPGKPNAAHDRGVERPVQEGADVSGVVHQFNDFPRRERRLVESKRST